MNFYQAMQLGASSLKPIIKECDDKNIKRKYVSALIVKDILCILFCMGIVISFSNLFGSENSIVGVVTVLSLLTFRFSNLNFDVKESTFTIMFIFGICMIGPYLASLSNPFLCFIINFICIMSIVILSCHNVMLANQSTFVLSYLLLYGYGVSDIKGYINRVIGLVLCSLIVCSIFYFKQRKIKFENNILNILKDTKLKSERTKWQIKLSLGVCSAMLLGDLLNLPRTIWIGFSCMSILQPSTDKMEFRYKTRTPYVIIGSILFGIVYLILPKQYLGNIGMIGGLMVGISATYQWQTVYNCFGALATAVPTFGLTNSIILRSINNLFGAIYSKVFDRIFDGLYEKILDRKAIDEVIE